MSYGDMVAALARGCATVGGDTGHQSADPNDLKFGIGHPEKIRDWGTRSIHAITQAAKPAIAAVQGKAINRSYYQGCSTGGHQGYAQLQRYPDDFDANFDRLAQQQGSAAAVATNARLFLVPGMGHCGGGTGTSNVDWLTALDNWVESGTAPDVLPASRVANQVVNRTRPICAYPKEARYSGTGSVDDAANFSCS